MAEQTRPTAPDTSFLAWLGSHEPTALRKLAGDASDRTFWRVSRADGATAVLMHYGGSEGHGPAIGEFLNIRAYLEQRALPVPALIEAHPACGCVLLEDLGDVPLAATLTPERFIERYHAAIDLLAELQERCEPDLACPAFSRSFDTEKLLWELNFFLTHTVEGFHGLRLSFPERRAIEEELHQLAVRLDVPRKVFAHRDYHSRNLMDVEGRLVLIDFQDARLGSPFYDLVSLLRDSYIPMDEATRSELCGYAHQRLSHRVLPGWSPGAFDHEFALHALQRNLKAAGSFGFLSTVKGKPSFAESLPYTYEMVWSYLEAAEGWPKLRGLLGELRAELPARLAAFRTAQAGQ